MFQLRSWSHHEGNYQLSKTSILPNYQAVTRRRYQSEAVIQLPLWRQRVIRLFKYARLNNGSDKWPFQIQIRFLRYRAVDVSLKLQIFHDPIIIDDLTLGIYFRSTLHFKDTVYWGVLLSRCSIRKHGFFTTSCKSWSPTWEDLWYTTIFLNQDFIKLHTYKALINQLEKIARDYQI